MQPFTPKQKPVKKESWFKKLFSNLFCLRQDRAPSIDLSSKRSQRMSRCKQKLTIHMSLLGSYKSSTLCKISRKNFIVNTHELENGRLPAACSKYIGEKLFATAAVVLGQVSTKVTKKIPLVFKLIENGDKIVGESFRCDIRQFKTRIDQLCVYRPKLEICKTLTLLDQDDTVTKNIQHIAKNYTNSVVIFPKDINLDEIGVVLSSVNKFVQIQTIVANATPLCVIAYIGTKQLVMISEAQQMQFVVKQLNKDLIKSDPNISILIHKIYTRSSIFDILAILRKSIQQAYIDTVFSCFLTNAICREIITHEEVVELFPMRANEAELQHTPSLRMTARFNFTTSEHFKHSCSDDFLNGENGELIFENEVETFAETEISMVGMEIMGEYNPY